jgi:hypothetical protein
MQVDLDFHTNKIRMTDTVRAVSYFTAVDSVESEQGIGQFLPDEPLETRIQKTESEITAANARVTKYKEWSSRWFKKKAVMEALDKRFEKATREAELENATEVEKALPELIRKEMVAIYDLSLGGPIDNQVVIDATEMRALVDSWEGDPEEKDNVSALKADLRDLKKDRNIHDKAFGTIFKFLKETTGVELNAMVLEEETMKTNDKLRPKSVIYRAIRSRLLAMLKGDPAATRAHIRNTMMALPKVKTLRGLLSVLQALERTRILLVHHLQLYPNNGEVVQESDFKRALKTCFAGGQNEITVIQITLAQFAGDTAWETIKQRVYEMINNSLDELAESMARESLDAPIGDRKSFVLGFQDIQRGNRSPSSGRGGQSPARGQSPVLNSGHCYTWKPGKPCAKGDACEFLHGDNDNRFPRGTKRGNESPGGGGGGSTPTSILKTGRK